MRFTVLASGSKANCIYIEGESGSLLIDAGLSLRETSRRLAAAGGRDDVQAILLTHEHGDHIRGALPVARRFKAPLIGTGGTLSRFLSSGCSSPSGMMECTSGRAFSVAGFTITPFSTSHDAREPCGYVVGENGARLCCCTDTGLVSSETIAQMKKCDALVLESNHCPDMLREGPYPEVLKRRIASRHGHLSNRKTAACLRELAGTVTSVVLAHLSEVNNTAEKALLSASGGLGFFMDEMEIRAVPGGDRTECWNHWITL